MVAMSRLAVLFALKRRANPYGIRAAGLPARPRSALRRRLDASTFVGLQVQGLGCDAAGDRSGGGLNASPLAHLAVESWIVERDPALPARSARKVPRRLRRSPRTSNRSANRWRMRTKPALERAIAMVLDTQALIGGGGP